MTLRIEYKDGYEDLDADGYRETRDDRLEVVMKDGSRRYVPLEWVKSYGWVKA